MSHSDTPWRIAKTNETLVRYEAEIMSTNEDHCPYGHITLLVKGELPYHAEWKEDYDIVPRAKADAQFIVRAVNTHEELVEAVERLVSLIESHRAMYPALGDACDTDCYDNLVAKARGYAQQPVQRAPK
jgi:hypothetical protein